MVYVIRFTNQDNFINALKCLAKGNYDVPMTVDFWERSLTFDTLDDKLSTQKFLREFEVKF